MPVHFRIASHKLVARPIEEASHLQKPEQLLIRGGKTQCAELLQSSLVGKEVDLSTVFHTNNGFVDTVTSAYNHHHHLILKPDDVWIAILGQFSFYVNANAEKLRSHFVQHEGKKELVVEAVGSRYTVNFGALAHQMTDKLQESVVDKDLQQWILPDFTTTTLSDTIICSVLMMSTLKAYFDYKFVLICGIPSVTLEGEQSDWERLLARLDKLDSFGEEPKSWAAMLRPILTRFVRAFDGKPDVDFWKRVCHYEPYGSGSISLSGWITAFCVWSSKGKWQGPSLSKPPRTMFDGPASELVLDKVSYPVIDSNDVPAGYCEVDIKLDDNGEEFSCMMVSGQLAYSVEGVKKDTVRPLASWFMFVKGEIETVKQIIPPTITPTTQEGEGSLRKYRKKNKKTKWY